MPVSDPDVSRHRQIHVASFVEAGRREIATNLVGALAEWMTIRGWGERRAGDGAPVVAGGAEPLFDGIGMGATAAHIARCRALASTGGGVI